LWFLRLDTPCTPRLRRCISPCSSVFWMPHDGTDQPRGLVAWLALALGEAEPVPRVVFHDGFGTVELFLRW
jgi:hypothetical protein